MDVKKGLEIPGDRYKSMHSCKEFMQVIADVEMEKIKERFNQSKFVAVIVTSTACERGFSHMKLIKTDIRRTPCPMAHPSGYIQHQMTNLIQYQQLNIG